MTIIYTIKVKLIKLFTIKDVSDFCAHWCHRKWNKAFATQEDLQAKRHDSIFESRNISRMPQVKLNSFSK